MTTILLASLFAALAGTTFGVLVGRRRAAGPAKGKVSQVGTTDHAIADLRMFRRMDKMILSNVSFSYVAQEIADLIPETHDTLGVVVRTADERTGQLDVAAVSRTLDRPNDELSLHALAGSALPPDAIQRSGSRTAQAVNQRQVVSGHELADFERPTLEPNEAAKIQAHLGIRAVVAYPIVVEDRLGGALTFYYSKPAGKLSEHDYEIMQGLADEVGIAVENAKLLNQLGEMNKKLSQANSHLQEVDELKDDFIAVASHQLRGPLTAVKGYLSMLNEGDFGKVPPRQQTVLEQLARSTNEVINLINDMLSVSRINAQKFELAKTAVNLEELVTDVVEELRPLARQKSLRLILKMPKRPLGTLNLDPLRIRQVVLNLVDNAIKYTERGSVTVTLARTDGQVACTVKDTGIGIPADELSKLGEKFYRASNARKVITSGSGLGLYVVRETIARHGGTVVMQSTEGKGSTMGFTLPHAAVAAAGGSIKPQTAAV